jgi:outer membrane protein TolC
MSFALRFFSIVFLAFMWSQGYSVESATTLRIDLPGALRFAHTQGREKKTQDEELDLTDRALGIARRDLWPDLQATLGANVSKAADGKTTPSQNAGVGVSTPIPLLGGTASVNAGTTRTDTPGTPEQYSDTVNLSFSVPLLRGGGYIRWRSGLTAAERAWVGAQRAHQRFLEELSLSIAQRFWNLDQLRLARTLAGESVEKAQYLLEQSKALVEIARATPNDVLRAELGVAQAQQSVTDAQAALEGGIADFCIALGLDPDTRLEWVSITPNILQWDFDLAVAQKTALERRVDWAEALDHIDDVKRSLSLARRDLLFPQLDLSGGSGLSKTGNTPFDETLKQDPSWQLGVTLTLPASKRHEEHSYYTALISLARSQRALEASRQGIQNEVQTALRNLRKSETSLAIQKRQAEFARLKQEKSLIDYQAGILTNKDYLDSEGEVRQADNAVLAASIAMVVAELELRRATGCLSLHSDGRWRDEIPPYAAPRSATAPSTKVSE